ncbi:MAG: aminopeptidase P family protein [Ancrocorticia sp.]|jgi:Xaa-Pro aminopeptidase|nr:aminopeptidase P family protein [Ancrocorticia sp.]MCI2001531.1 aminopeptidase P family protein [Ancrocorticia sp.]
MSKQDMKERGNNRSRQPNHEAFADFISSDWAARPAGPQRAAVADYLPARHEAISKRFPGERIVIPAGTYKVRNNDCDYRFRAHSAFAHMTGLGGELEPDAVLVLNPTRTGHEATLYFHPRAPRSAREFYADSRYGEFWVGARPSLAEMSTLTGLRCDSIDNLPDALAKDLGPGQVSLRVVPEADASVQALVDELRERAEFTNDTAQADAELAEALSELRLTKDPWEIDQMRTSVALTKEGFSNIIASLPRAVSHWRGERVIEGAFGAKAREEGNGLGYDTIAAAGDHANTLHYMDNSGPVRSGELVLVDAGIESDSLYTADITRTLPVDGKFTDAQAEVYQAVLDAANYALERANQPDCRFADVHNAAMEVIADRLEKWGMLPCTAAESLASPAQYHRRWMPHGTSHHLGIDVHDCAQARREMYLEAELKPGMIFTIEPGLYFHKDDLKVPERFRGIGVRIEDDVLVTEYGVERISEDIPRDISDVEEWMASILKK